MSAESACLDCLTAPCCCQSSSGALVLRAPSFAFHHHLALANPRINQFPNPTEGPAAYFDIEKTASTPLKYGIAPGNVAVFKSTIGRARIQLTATAVIGWGAAGMVLGLQGNQVMKLLDVQPQSPLVKREIAYSQLASDLGVGPKVKLWGSVRFDSYDDFDHFATLPLTRSFADAKSPRPDWLGNYPSELSFIVTEQWDASLATYLQENNITIERLVDSRVVEDGVLEQFIRGLGQLHDHDAIHMDAYPKNILVRTNKRTNRLRAMCLTDFGNTSSTTEWFCASKSAFREAMLVYSSTDTLPGTLTYSTAFGQYMVQNFAATGVLGGPAMLEAWRTWLRDNPFNFDLQLWRYVASLKPAQLEPLFHPAVLKRGYGQPNRFLWSFRPKNSTGHVECMLDFGNKRVVQLKVHWLDTLENIREEVERTTQGSLRDLVFLYDNRRLQLSKKWEPLLQLSDLAEVRNGQLFLPAHAVSTQPQSLPLPSSSSEFYSDESPL